MNRSWNWSALAAGLMIPAIGSALMTPCRAQVAAGVAGWGDAGTALRATQRGGRPTIIVATTRTDAASERLRSALPALFGPGCQLAEVDATEQADWLRQIGITGVPGVAVYAHADGGARVLGVRSGVADPVAIAEWAAGLGRSPSASTPTPADPRVARASYQQPSPQSLAPQPQPPPQYFNPSPPAPAPSLPVAPPAPAPTYVYANPAPAPAPAPVYVAVSPAPTTYTTPAPAPVTLAPAAAPIVVNPPQQTFVIGPQPPPQILSAAPAAAPSMIAAAPTQLVAPAPVQYVAAPAPAPVQYVAAAPAPAPVQYVAAAPTQYVASAPTQLVAAAPVTAAVTTPQFVATAPPAPAAAPASMVVAVRPLRLRNRIATGFGEYLIERNKQKYRLVETATLAAAPGLGGASTFAVVAPAPAAAPVMGPVPRQAVCAPAPAPRPDYAPPVESESLPPLPSPQGGCASCRSGSRFGHHHKN